MYAAGLTSCPSLRVERRSARAAGSTAPVPDY
jgi:hypothetical protein